MKEFCQREHIRLDVSSVAHAQSNGQAKKSQSRNLERHKAPAYGPFAEDAGLLGGGITLCVMEHQYHPQQIYGLHAFLHGLRSRGGSP